MSRDRASIKVLLVDDFALFREGVSVSLQRHGEVLVVGEAADVPEAIERAEALQPDVVLLDMRLPGGGGLVALDKLRSVSPSSRVLVLTANDRPEGVIDAVSAGAAGYLTKRADGDELAAAVMAVAGGGSVVEPAMAGHLMRELAGGSEGVSGVALSGREREALRLVCDGLTDQQIAERLYVSVRTVQNDLRRIREKAGVTRRAELVRWAANRSLA